MGAVQARRKQAEEAPRGGARDGRDALGGEAGGRLGPPPAHSEGERAYQDYLRACARRIGGGGLDEALARSPGAPLGIEQILPREVSRALGEARGTGPWGQRTFAWTGREPARAPDGTGLLRAFRGFVETFRATLNDAFARATAGIRDEEACAYSSLTLCWTVVLGFVQHFRSRNQMDAGRNEGAYAASVLECSGQPYAASDPRLRAACSQTCRNLLAKVDPRLLEDALVSFVRRLLRGKWLDRALLCGCVCVAVDGTLCERKRGAGLSPKERRRYALEARVLTPWGWNIPVMSEPVAAYDGDREKQDCELAAFKRLAPRLKGAFPHLPVCIVGDALYACSPVMEVCRGFGWKFLLTFKEGSMPETHGAALAAQLRRRHCGYEGVRDGDGGGRVVGAVTWASADEVCYELGRDPGFNVVSYVCFDAREGAYSGAFATDLDVNEVARALEVAAWGRRRWNVENGFKVEKHSGFGLEHTFCNDETAGRNYHVLMQVAYALWQVFDGGMLRRLGEGCRKMTQEEWARLLASALRFVGLAAFPPASVAGMRMRRFHFAEAA